jgi:hypothetical protein
MTTKTIEKLLNNNFSVISFDVTLKNNTFTIDMNIETPRDNQDWNNLMLLKNKIRSEVNRVYKIDFVINYTMRFTT